jgi:hypothetical protein
MCHLNEEQNRKFQEKGKCVVGFGTTKPIKM